jgi:large subunit ribosomal protein L25
MKFSLLGKVKDINQDFPKRKVRFMATLLEVKERKDLKNSTTTKIRREGNFPAVVYGKNKPNRTIYIDSTNFSKAIRESGRNGILNLKVGDSGAENVMLQDIQTDPLKAEVVHADFYIVDMNSEVDVEVTVHLIGEAKGVKDGGILQQPLHQVSVKALPNEIPEVIEFDISELEIGDTVQVSDLTGGGRYSITDDENTVIASVLPPNTEEKVESGEVQDGGDVQAVKEEEEAKDDDQKGEA